ncbi:hypothetical protein MDUV_12150 [Mycolicibacterium duvalii]|uniref:Tandem-95 repeat protein n=1 Tax=Mycolicibacterium duvalii TaxID=39688 RepID=A0A7I7JX13_9MYCO|nr:hypothetical protein MDUV_12150 [Mycolicibacterium duvalii]
MSVSAGLGAAVLLGGAGTAAADSAPSSRSSESSSSSASPAASGTAPERSTAERTKRTRDRSDRAERRRSTGAQELSAAQEFRALRADRTDSADAADDMVPATATAPTEASNAAPEVATTVERPDPLTGVTRVTVTGTDPDSDELTYTATSPRLGRVSGDGSGAFTYTPTPFARVLARILPVIRSDRFTVTVSDGRGGRTPATVTVTLVPLNRAPRSRPATVHAPAPATGTITGRARAVDPDRDRLTYLVSTTETGRGTVTVRGDGTFTYVPSAAARHRAAADAASPADRIDTFRITVTDVFGAVTEIPVAVTISPFNTAPTGVATADVADPASGVVTGRVLGSDDDGDDLVYRATTTAARGVVVMGDDGVFTYTPSESARRLAASMYATPALRSDTVTVTITDSHGGTTVVPVRVAVSPDPQAPATVAPSTFCGCTMMPADTIFHADIRHRPRLAETDSWIELLGGSRGATMGASWGGAEWMGSTAGIPVNVVGPDHPTETVVFNRGYSTSGPGIDDRPYAIPHRPLVEGMPSYPAWDRHLFVFQEGTCISQELINVANGVELPGAGILDILGNAVYRSIWGSTWIAQGGVQYDMSSSLYPAIGYANAAHLPQVPLMVRPDDIQRGYIDHMLGMTIAKDVGAGYVWPARAGDGTGTEGIPMGMVFRLRDDIDLRGYAESTQTVLRALQVHGAVIYDSRAPGGDGLKLAGMSNGWEDVEGFDVKEMQRELSSIPVQWFDAVDVVGMAADPTLGWQVTTTT